MIFKVLFTIQSPKGSTYVLGNDAPVDADAWSDLLHFLGDYIQHDPFPGFLIKDIHIEESP